MSISSGLIAALFLAYMALLFSIAFYGERRPALSLAPWVRPQAICRPSSRFIWGRCC